MSGEAVARAQGRRPIERSSLQFPFRERRVEHKLQKCKNCGEEAVLVNGWCEECNLLMIIQRRKRKNTLLKKFGGNQSLDDDEAFDLIKILSEDLEIQTNMTIENQGRIIKDQEDKLNSQKDILERYASLEAFQDEKNKMFLKLCDSMDALEKKVDDLTTFEGGGKIVSKKKKAEEVLCEFCGKPLTKIQISRGAKYCSRKCFAEDLKEAKK